MLTMKILEDKTLGEFIYNYFYSRIDGYKLLNNVEGYIYVYIKLYIIIIIYIVWLMFNIV